MEPYEKISKILRTDKHNLLQLDRRLSAVTGKKDVMRKILDENETTLWDRLAKLGVSRDAKAKEVYDALIARVKEHDELLFIALGQPNYTKSADCQRVADIAKKIEGSPKGFFLKLEKAKEFLKKEPPRQVMALLGYTSVDEMLEKEDLFEVYSSLRFIEGNEWLNEKFFKQYEHLTPDDFEEREIEVRALGEKWGTAAQKFVMKKKHNISHLKELGVVFIIPVMLGIHGEVLRMVALIFHYLNEIPFYSDIFRDISKNKITFTSNFVSLLRGDVLEHHLAETDRSPWLIVQRYLAKDDDNDWRLFVPHLNPEAVHWDHAETALVKVGASLDAIGDTLKFWQGLGWVGDYFKDETGVEVLVSFDLVDTVMSLVKEKELEKYLYHHEEALWNKIFASYFGDDQLQEFSKRYLLQGYFEI